MENKNLLFSIIIPVYNIENYVHKCLTSIKNQTFKEFEAVIIDDGSTDKSFLRCKEIINNDNRFFLLHTTNKGVVAARKKGTEIASGKFICCVDGDDEIVPNYLEKLATIVYKFNPDVICFNSIIENIDYTTRELLIPLKEGMYSQKEIVKYIFPSLIYGYNGPILENSLWNKIWKKDKFSLFQNELDEQLKIGEDSVLGKVIISNSNSLYVSKDCLYIYKIRNNSAMTSKKSLSLNIPIARGLFLEKFISQNNFDFEMQISLEVLLSLFDVCISQFYGNQKYSVIKTKLLSYLNTPYFVRFLNKKKVGRILKDKIKIFILKHRMIFLLKLFSQFRK